MSFCGTYVVYADVESLSDESLFRKAYLLASEARRVKVDRLRARKDKNLSLGAELLLRYSLGNMNVDLDSGIRYGKNGKPYLKDGPFFSLSHSEGYAACAVSDREVGCDIERLKSADIRVAERFFHSGEYERIAGASGDARSELFYRYWVLKESFLKATGTGLSVPLRDFEIELDSGISIAQHHGEQRYGFAEFDGIPGYRLAVCTAYLPCRPQFYQVDLKSILQ